MRGSSIESTQGQGRQHSRWSADTRRVALILGHHEWARPRGRGIRGGRILWFNEWLGEVKMIIQDVLNFTKKRLALLPVTGERFLGIVRGDNGGRRRHDR